MKKVKKIEWWRVALVAASLISIAVDRRDVTANRMPPKIRHFATGTFTVSIIAPTINGKRAIERWDGVPRLRVEIRNTSNNSQQVWAEDCCFGYGALALEIFAIDGKELQKPIVVGRNHDPLWDVDRLRNITIAPGETIIRDIPMHRYCLGEKRSRQNFSNDFDYMDFPSLHGGVHTLRLRAVFSNTQYKSNPNEVWMGSFVSPTQDCTVSGPYL